MQVRLLCVALSIAVLLPLSGEADSLYYSRYVNCDYGYFVDVPLGVVAHGNDPPAPNHGFGIDLSNPASTTNLPDARPRYLYVDASYDSLEWGLAKHAISWRFDNLKHKRPDARITSRSALNLAGLHAIRAKMEYEPGRIEELVVAMRQGIVYEVGLYTSAADYKRDVRVFDTLVRGFKLKKIVDGHECSNAGAR